MKLDKYFQMYEGLLAETLKEIGDEQAVEPLIEALRDRDRGIT